MMMIQLSSVQMMTMMTTTRTTTMMRNMVSRLMICSSCSSSSNSGGGGGAAAAALVNRWSIKKDSLATIAAAATTAAATPGAEDVTRMEMRDSVRAPRLAMAPIHSPSLNLMRSFRRAMSAKSKKGSKPKSAAAGTASKNAPPSTAPPTTLTRNVVVFGGSGYIGRRVCRELVAMNNNAQLTCFLNMMSSGAGSRSVEKIKKGADSTQSEKAHVKVHVTSVSRQGCFMPLPTTSAAVSDEHDWIRDVNWMQADVTSLLLRDTKTNDTSNTKTSTDDQLMSILRDADAVISCIGAFGSNEFMVKMNGDVNVAIASNFSTVKKDIDNTLATSSVSSAPRFVFISSAVFNFPSFVLTGYFQGKKKTETAVDELFGENGFILQPGMVHGTRQVSDTVSLPLSIIGSPLEMLLASTPIRTISGNSSTTQRYNDNNNLNFFQSSFVGRLLAAPPILVDNVAKAAAVAALMGRNWQTDADDDVRSSAANYWTYDKMIEVSNRV